MAKEVAKVAVENNITVSFAPERSPKEIYEAIAGALRAARKLEVHEAVQQVRDEIARQDEKWGQQDHPARPGGEEGDALRALYEYMADYWKGTNANRAEAGALAWDGILREEVYEALAETDPEKYEQELIQVAAVAIQAYMASRRNRYADYRQRYVTSARWAG